jgi:hypothetical protein
MFFDAGRRLLGDCNILNYRLGEDLDSICEAFGIAALLRHHNVSKFKDDDVIPDHLKAEMRAFYELDYALWGRLEAVNAVGLEKLRVHVGGTA